MLRPVHCLLHAVLVRQQHTIMSGAASEQEGGPTSATQGLDRALGAHRALGGLDDVSAASSAAEGSSSRQASGMGGFASFDVAHRFFPVSGTSRRVVARFLHGPTASCCGLLGGVYSALLGSALRRVVDGGHWGAGFCAEGWRRRRRAGSPATLRRLPLVARGSCGRAGVR